MDTVRKDLAETVVRRVYTVEEAACLLGISRSSAFTAVRRGELPSLRIGRRLVIPRAALDKMLEVAG